MEKLFSTDDEILDEKSEADDKPEADGKQGALSAAERLGRFFSSVDKDKSENLK